tara:strand:+ start:701 stop:1216 length:516 start_codon:yes stop_codon:yes gene_type:complete
MKSLLLGAGNSRIKTIAWQGREWGDLTTLDIDPLAKPDIEWDLNERPLPFADDAFDQIHAYEVLEHIGVQGYWRAFFDEFGEYWRILKPGGVLCGTVPDWRGEWAWGDPGHTRVITPGSFAFLSQAEYRAQVGKTRMTDYRAVYKADFERLESKVQDGFHYFVLKAVKGGV